MSCNLCNGDLGMTVITSDDMRQAVERGFNPFKHDFPLPLPTGHSSYRAWREDAVNGSKALSEWVVCDTCMQALGSFLPVPIRYVRFSCPSCSQSLEVDEAYRGDEVTCPTCNANIPVPTVTAAECPPPDITPRCIECGREATEEAAHKEAIEGHGEKYSLAMLTAVALYCLSTQMQCDTCGAWLCNSCVRRLAAEASHRRIPDSLPHRKCGGTFKP